LYSPCAATPPHFFFLYSILSGKNHLSNTLQMSCNLIWRKCLSFLHDEVICNVVCVAYNTSQLVFYFRINLRQFTAQYLFIRSGIWSHLFEHKTIVFIFLSIHSFILYHIHNTTSIVRWCCYGYKLIFIFPNSHQYVVIIICLSERWWANMENY
jgi:hypothetical protein